MAGLADDLYIAAKERLTDLGHLLDGLTGRLAASADATRSALGVFELYRTAITSQIDDDWASFPDEEARLNLLRFYLRDIGNRLEELEEWFAGGADASVPPALVDAVSAECAQLLTSTRQVILAVGDPDNMATLVVELTDLVFQSTSHLLAKPQWQPPQDKFALIQVSRFEGSNPIWRPLIVGHELAHLALLDYSIVEDFDVANRLDAMRVAGLNSPPSHYPNLAGFQFLAVQTAAEDWLEELICDAYAVRRWGPAAVAAVGSYFEQVGATSGYGSHPPGWFRIRMMLEWLGPVVHQPSEAMLQPWHQLASTPLDVEDEWAEYLLEVFEALSQEIPPLIDGWLESYDLGESASRVDDLAAAFCRGIPRAENLVGDVIEPATDAEIVNSAWIARAREHPGALYSLVEKALDSADFLRRWRAAGGELSGLSIEDVHQDLKGSGLLTERAIRERFGAEGDAQFTVTPMLPKAIGETSIDLRLGRHFIVFQRSSTGAFDALQDSDDPRTMQRAVERRWAEPFVLHPGELVLAATLEYIVLPPDIGAQVITRSSYGRLGLITATAIQVHPLFRGCLTLELVNLGALPVSLYPGERIAQLALSYASPPLEPAQPGSWRKYDCPTKPEFSRVRTDWDAEILRKLGRPAG